MITPKGQITAILRDAVTLEALSEQTVDNIVTEAFYDEIGNNMRLDIFQLCLNGKEMGASRWTRAVPGNRDGNAAVFPNANIPSHPTYELFQATDTTPAFLQYAGRFNVPAAARTIKTVLLTNSASSQGSLDNSDDYTVIYAYAKLNTPCTQTTSQVLDVYYRIFFPIEEGSQKAFMTELFTRYTSNIDNSTLLNQQFCFPTPVALKPKAGDENFSMVGVASTRFGSGYALGLPTTASGGKRTWNWNAGFPDHAGSMFSSLISGGKQMINYYEAVSAQDASSAEYSPLIMGVSNLKLGSKIQNLIGHGTTNKPITATPWLDVDNLPGGTGKAFLSGTWNNRAMPLAPGLYAPAELPELNILQVAASGKISLGTCSYTYVRQKYFGNRPVTLYAWGTNTSNSLSPSIYTTAPLPNLCCTGPAIGAPAGYWRAATYDAGKTIMEEVNPTVLSVRQITAMHKYDKSSVVVVKKNKLILYSIGAGDYWKFNGPYTDIHQVAVVEGKIYAACRDTGLYVIDPTTSLAVVSLAAPAAGVDLSRCFGVAKGYNNSVCAVGVNGLMILTAGVWTKHDEASAQPFAITGVSDGKWSNIEYLKVDELSAAFEMLLVRRLDADVNAASFGVWWSTAGAASDSFNDALPRAMGRPRTNRTHFGGYDGLWAIANGTHKVMAFKAAVPTAVVGGNAIYDGKFADLYASIFFVQAPTGETRLMTMHDHVTAGYATNVGSQVAKLVTPQGDITHTVTTGLSHGVVYNNDIFGREGRAWSSMENNNYGYGDCGCSIILDKGVMVSALYRRENQYDQYGAGQGKVDNFFVAVSNFGLDMSLSGGPLAYLARRSYGWTGSEWSTSVTTPKPMHLAAQPLSDGVEVRFEDGAAGDAFVIPNYYRFGLCEGLLKDNATRHNLSSVFYSRRRVTSSQVSSPTVPLLTELSTGIVGVDESRSSPGMFLNADNQIQAVSEAGGMYAMGNKQLTGDFELSYDCTGLSTTPELNTHSLFGVCKAVNMASIAFGFHFSGIYLYARDGNTYTQLATGLAGIYSLKIRRIAGVLELLVNDVVRVTNDASRSGIRARDDRLDVFVMVPSSPTVLHAYPNKRFPKATILSNGSDRMVFVGDPVAKTGAYNLRFCAGLLLSETSVSLAGVPAVIKNDGTAPLAGEVSLDEQSGALYFNAADEGKPITAETTWLQSN